MELRKASCQGGEKRTVCSLAPHKSDARNRRKFLSQVLFFCGVSLLAKVTSDGMAPEQGGLFCTLSSFIPYFVSISEST